MKIINFIKDHKWLITIIAFAVILRFAYLFLIHPPLSWADASLYDTVARNFSQGNGYTYSLTENEPFATREPGYIIFFLTPIYFIFGHSILAAQIFQIIISVFIILLTYLIAKEILPKKLSLLSAFIITAWPPMIGYTGEILTEIYFTFLLLVFMFLLIKAIQNPSKKLFFASGLILGLATLARFIMFFFPVFLLPILYIIFRDRHKTFTYFLLILIGVAIFVSPWIIRNYMIYDAFILGRLGGGEIYWMGSYVPWDGEWFGYIEPFLSLCPKAKSAIEGDQCLTRLAIENIKENPLGVGLIWLKKPLKVFLIPEGFEFISTFAAKLKINTAFAKMSYLGLYLTGIIFAILGLRDLFYTKRKIALLFSALLIYYTLMLLPLNPIFRYQIPILPIISILASFGLYNFYLLIKSKIQYG